MIRFFFVCLAVSYLIVNIGKGFDVKKTNDSIVIYNCLQKVQNIDHEFGNDIGNHYYRSINITLDYKIRRYQIKIKVFDDASGVIFITSQGYFTLDSQRISMVDKNNSFIHTGILSNDTLHYITGIKDIKDIKLDKVDFKNNEFENRFSYWNAKFGDNFRQKTKKTNNSILIFGTYISKDKTEFLEITNESWAFYIIDGNKTKITISSGKWETKKSKIILKEDDKINIMEAYLVDDTIYPVNHFPNTMKNAPLKLNKK